MLKPQLLVASEEGVDVLYGIFSVTSSQSITFIHNTSVKENLPDFPGVYIGSLEN